MRTCLAASESFSYDTCTLAAWSLVGGERLKPGDKLFLSTSGGASVQET